MEKKLQNLILLKMKKMPKSDPFMEGMAQSSHDVSKSKVELDEHSQASSEVIELEPCANEVQLTVATLHLMDTSKSKSKKSF